MQYVGSAYGEEGILGRWKHYAKTAHGDNQELKRILAADPEAANRFRFTILRTLPRTLTMNEVIEHEGRYKKKLGSRAFGLNVN